MMKKERKEEKSEEEVEASDINKGRIVEEKVDETVYDRMSSAFGDVSSATGSVQADDKESKVRSMGKEYSTLLHSCIPFLFCFRYSRYSTVTIVVQLDLV